MLVGGAWCLVQQRFPCGARGSLTWWAPMVALWQRPSLDGIVVDNSHIESVNHLLSWVMLHGHVQLPGGMCVFSFSCLIKFVICAHLVCIYTYADIPLYMHECVNACICAYKNHTQTCPVSKTRYYLSVHPSICIHLYYRIYIRKNV